jgi:hypothetical protein
MNPFVNPKKRSILLPKGSNDLADLLHSPKSQPTKSKSSDPAGNHIQAWIRSLLVRSRDRRATELVIGPAPDPDADCTDCTVTEKIDGTWHHVLTLPSAFRSATVAELVRMAAFTGDQFPGVGLLALQLKRKRLMWRIEMETPGSQCVLTPLRQW